MKEHNRSHRILVRIVRAALMAALICVLSPFSIPTGIVPITLSLLAVLLTAVILPPPDAAAAVVVYIALGAVGLPVFSGGAGGFSVLVGPTGGYIWAYLLTGLFVSALTRLPVMVTMQNRTFRWLTAAGISFVGVLLCYVCGTVQFVFVRQVAPLAALSACVFPFIIPDILKCLLASWLGLKIREILQKM